MNLPSRALIAAAALVLVTGCGDNATDAKSDPSEPAGAETSAPAKPAAPAYRTLSKRKLTDALLGVQDLPPGYSQDPPSPDSANKTFCDYRPPFNEKVKVRRDFTKGGGMSAELLSIGLRQYANPKQAKVAFNALTEALETCKGENYEGTKMAYTPMSAPKVGDVSIGVKISADGTTLLQTFALVGPTLVNTGGGGLMNASADDVNTLLGAQVKAYKAASAQ